jgi:hypothetical protein
MYYIGTVMLNMREEIFWRCTPKKLFSLIEVHATINSPDGVKASQSSNKDVLREISGW